jgi:hypothetical protein
MRPSILTDRARLGLRGLDHTTPSYLRVGHALKNFVSLVNIRHISFQFMCDYPKSATEFLSDKKTLLDE